MKKIILAVLICSSFFVPLYAQDNGSPFELTLVVPARLDLGKRPISKSLNNKPELHVILKNISDKPQKIWSESYSWGYENLSFEMILDGKRVLIEKKPREWEKNFPDYWTILSGEYFVFDVSLTSEEWNFPSIEEASKIAELKAVYRNTSNSFKTGTEGNYEGFWTGRIESEPLEVTLYR
ncbi:MAG: hypothetical protein PHV55_07045 [Candidatus Omnitrophica bacterium]|nr:hypothetical protein [Candidatus Omnitrophota bacterium]